ncbi:GNAT family N-acetyltransferase [Paenalcaligenes hermetiae]|uniref:GNAT family N-acetyltransferase n=1 Tax=Paenalcaligenes hermetiae TaxID=1157987 RepID=A0ABP9LUI1_9BURK
MVLTHRFAALFDPKTVVTVCSPDCAEHLSFHENAAVYRVCAPAGQGKPLQGLKAIHSERVDLGVICVPAEQLLEVLNQLSPYQPRFLVLLTHPSSQLYSAEMQKHLGAWAKQQHCKVLGPRSLGLIRPPVALNASIQPRWPKTGKVALISQSRTVTTAVLDWAEDANVGFSTVVDLGEETDIDLADMLDFLATDKQTDSLVLYLHSYPTSRRFASALYAAAATKPIIVLKAGGQDNSVALRAREEVFNALMRRVGAIRIRYLMQLFAAVKILSLKRRLKGSRIAIIANGDGIAQLALAIMRHNATVHLAPLSAETQAALAAVTLTTDQITNPIIRYAPITVDVVEQVIPVLIKDKQVDGVLVLIAPDPYADLEAVTEALISISLKQYKPVVSCLLGEKTMRPLRQRLDQAGIPALRTADAAMEALNILASYHYNQQLAQQILPAYPLGRPANIEAARQLVQSLQEHGVRHLDEMDSAQLLACFHVPILTQASPYTVPTLPPVCIHMYTDAQYGPFMVFGAAYGDLDFISQRTAVELPPLNRNLARLLIERAPIWYERLHDIAGESIFTQLQQTLEKISELISELPAIKSIQIDPLWLSPSGLYCSQIKIELHPQVSWLSPENLGYPHMAIHPYPRHLVQHHHFDDGQPWVLRPIRPEDAQPLQDFVRGLSAESRYMRFVSMMKELSPSMLARYTRIDYDRELALIATIDSGQAGTEQVIAFVHYLRNSDGRGAEYALVVADDWQRYGLGTQLMRALIQEAKQQRLSYIDGYVLATNDGMLGLLAKLGFKSEVDPYDPGLRRVWLDLTS